DPPPQRSDRPQTDVPQSPPRFLEAAVASSPALDGLHHPGGASGSLVSGNLAPRSSRSWIHDDCGGAPPPRARSTHRHRPRGGDPRHARSQPRVRALLRRRLPRPRDAAPFALGSSRTPSGATVLALIGAYAAASQARFEVGTGLFLPTSLIFVPMLFLLPLGSGAGG